MLFRPKLLKIAQDELYEAERKLLEAQTGLEWAQSQVTYRTGQAARLRAYVAEMMENQRQASNDPQPAPISGNSRA